MVRAIARQRAELDVTALTLQVKEFATLKAQMELLTKREREVKSRLAALVEQFGEEDDKGHVWLQLPKEAAGTYVSLQRQRRVSQTLDEDRAQEILAGAGLVERCYTLVPVLSEDEVMAAHYEGLLSEADIDAMFPKKISYAFVPSKG